MQRFSLTYFNESGNVARVANVAGGGTGKAFVDAAVATHWPADDEGNDLPGYTAFAMVGWDATGPATALGYGYTAKP
ncbi:MAG TPA: hypothetical protein VGG10_15235 [Rhizomicrobium sp.]|jgi:hypothetical protein